MLHPFEPSAAPPVVVAVGAVGCTCSGGHGQATLHLVYTKAGGPAGTAGEKRGVISLGRVGWRYPATCHAPSTS